MTKRDEERLAKLLAEKEKEEKHDHEFFAEARRRKDETLRVLGVHVGAMEAVQRRAVEVGISIDQMIRVIEELSVEQMEEVLRPKDCKSEANALSSRGERLYWRGRWRKRKKAKNRRKHLS